jgi:hypothetical protein
VKLLRRLKKGFAFHLSEREKQLLLATLKLYPLVPASHHRLSQNAHGKSADENQRLLEESLAEQREENRRQVLAFFDDPKHFRQTKTDVRLSLTYGEVEWLLQVLNDVRVGGWLALGEPEHGHEPEITEENARYYFGLEVGGAFQSVLLEALGVSESAQWAGE